MRVHYMLRRCPKRSYGALSERACAAPRRTTARAKGMFCEAVSCCGRLALPPRDVLGVFAAPVRAAQQLATWSARGMWYPRHVFQCEVYESSFRFEDGESDQRVV